MYIGVPPFGQTIRTISEKIAIAAQVDFYPDGGYLPGYIDIELNGQALRSTDFLAADGVKVTLLVACAANDEFTSIAYWPVSLVDTYRKSEADALFPTKAGVGATGTWGINVSGSAGSVAWANVTSKPSFATVATSGAYGDLSGRPSLATVATSGAYVDLSGRPSLGAAAALNLSVYDSGWYAVSRDTSYTKAHNLGGNNLLILNYFSYDAASVFTQTFPSFHSGSHAYTGGAVIVSVDATNYTIRTGANDLIGYSPYPNTDTMRFGGVDHMTAGGQVSGYYRTLAIKLA